MTDETPQEAADVPPKPGRQAKPAEAKAAPKPVPQPVGADDAPDGPPRAFCGDVEVERGTVCSWDGKDGGVAKVVAPNRVEFRFADETNTVMSVTVSSEDLELA